jgi:hypothetical protein
LRVRRHLIGESLSGEDFDGYDYYERVHQLRGL